MEPIFINQYVRTKNLFRECMNAVVIRQPGTIIIYLFSMLYFIYGGWSLVFRAGDSQKAFGVFMIVLAVILAVVIPLKTTKKIKLVYARELETNQGQPREINFTVMEEEIKGFTTSKDVPTVTIQFKDVKRVIETKNYYILATKAKLLLAFSKEGFVKGTLEEFLAFLRSRGFHC